MTPLLALYLYRLVFVAFIVFASVKTFIEGWPAPQGDQAASFMPVFIKGLAAAEVVAALGLLWMPAQLVAGAALVLIFAIATVVDLRFGGIPVRFAYYTGTVLILVFLQTRLSAAPQA